MTDPIRLRDHQRKRSNHAFQENSVTGFKRPRPASSNGFPSAPPMLGAGQWETKSDKPFRYARGYIY